MTDTATAVRAMTAAWLRELPLDKDTVVSGAGLWPLLALLSGAADGPARSELADAAGMDADSAADAAVALLSALDASPDIAVATGTWLRPGIELHEWWRAHVPPESIGELTSEAALDAWARERTDGLIKKMPVRIDPSVLIVLASALLLRTSWQVPFTEHERAGRTWLRRTVGGVGDVCTVTGGDGPVTVATVRGEQDVDVLLAIGAARATSGDVITALLTGNPAAIGPELLDQPGEAPAIEVRQVRGHEPETLLTVPSFEVRRTHDLLAHPEVFGLRAASEVGGFPKLSPSPLKVDQAVQEVLARFFATGFEAAAVTGFAMKAAAVIREATTRQLAVSFDRPFAFAAVHRPSGVPVVAGWVADAG